MGPKIEFKPKEVSLMAWNKVISRFTATAVTMTLQNMARGDHNGCNLPIVV